MRKNKRMSYIMVFALMMAISFSAITPVNAAVALNDIGGHWAQRQIETLANQGVVNGYLDGSFKPDNTISRAEFITMANKAFNFTDTGTIDYLDVQPGDWFANEIARAKAAGYISGYQDGTMQPNNQISRQEVAIIAAKILKLDTLKTNNILQQFQDAPNIPSWSKAFMAAAVKASLIKGYPDSTVRAENPITRAEAVVIISQALLYKPVSPGMQTLYDKAGTFGPASGSATIAKDVSITADGVILQNTVIQGDLLISEAVGAGTVTLKQVTVTGTTTIKGGGENSIYLEGCKLAAVKAEKDDGKLRIVLSGDTSINEFVANSAVKVAGKGTITKATINKNGVTIEATPGETVLASGINAAVGGKTVYGPSGGGGGGGGGGSTGPSIVADLAAGTHNGDFKITSGGTKGPSTGTAVVTGTLYLDPGASGSISLRNVKANNIQVLSGAPNTIIFINVEVTVTLNVNTGTQTNAVRIVTQGSTSIAQTTVSSAVTLAQDTGSSLGNIQLNSAVNVNLASGNFSAQTVTVTTTASGAGVNVGADTTVGTVVANTSVKLSGDGSVGTVQVAQANTRIEVKVKTVTKVEVTEAAAGANVQVGQETTVTTVVVNAEIQIDNAGTITTVTTAVTVAISGNQPGTTEGNGTVVEVPSLKGDIKVGDIPAAITPAREGYEITFAVNPAAAYSTGTAALSTNANYRLQSGSINVTGTLTTSDSLITEALNLLASHGGTGSSVYGSTLISRSPVTITLISTINSSLSNKYIVKFIARPILSNVKLQGTAPGVSGESWRPTLTFTVVPTATYTTGSAQLSEDVSCRIKNAGYEIDATVGSSDNLLDLALSLFALQGGTNGNVLGSTLIANSPLTLTLIGADATTVYTIKFVSN